MNKKKYSYTVLGMSLLVMLVGIIPISAEEKTKVIGVFEATTIDVQIPAVTNFIYNPNDETMTTGNLTITSKTNAPIYANLEGINVSDYSTWQPNLVAPDTYTTEGWQNLTKAQSEKQVAVGLKSLESDNWLFEMNNPQIWSSETNRINKLGTIKNHGVVDTQPILKAGNSISTEGMLATNYLFEFGLEKGEEIVEEKVEEEQVSNAVVATPTYFEKTVANTSTEELFTKQNNAFSPTIIGNELYVTDYFDANKIYVYDTNTKELKRIISYHSKQTVSGGLGRFYSLGTDGEYLLAFSSANTIEVLDKETGKILGIKTLSTNVYSSVGLIGSPTFIVKNGYLYASGYYSNNIMIFDWKTGKLVKTISGFTSTCGISIHNGKLIVLERYERRFHVFNISDTLNPIKENTVVMKNGYDNVGLTMDNNYIYVATYQGNKVIRYPLAK